MKSPVWMCAKYQSTVLCVITALIISGIGDKRFALSFFLGGIVYILPNLYFVHYAFRYRGAQAASLISSSFVWGEAGKLALCACGFIAVYRLYPNVHHGVLFAGFLSMIVTQWWVASKVVKHLAQSSDQSDLH